MCDSSSDTDIVPSSSIPDVSAGWHEAEFILKIIIKEQYSLSQVAVDQVVASTKVLMKDVLSSVLDFLKATETHSLISQRINTASTSLFSGLCSAYLQNKYFRECFKLVVSVLSS